ncbi:TonB-dependent receptor [Luteolibacter yonseiensis]|uniref:TonB-dependent receptor n=1 Tax=Luteolibacter yonseiensis TaxID=1144680 RepID=A0A934R5G7_9BACT|nr:TonB-dependent receptor [Luteolibacter yonseiensis]MBK1817332.1 TonB-dependent receptor [Luteolibacter yonseiensis]
MKPFSRSLISWLGLLAAAVQSTTAQETSEAVALDAVVVTANRSDLTLFQQVQPTNLLIGKDLQYKLQPTLGETLDREPGVSSTSFGPGASRPVVRGLGDDRVRILQNGTSVLDVSNVSPDHAVAVDPLTIRSVEVVRGPATLLYGPNTIGGVVNVIDDRIPQERFSGTYPSGKFATSVGSADDLFSQSGAITWGSGPLVFHLDGFNRETDDIEIPGYARSAALRKADPLPAGEEEAHGTLPNSATHSKGAGLGGSYIWDSGFLGFSYSGVDSTYGTVAEPDVTIGLSQRRWDMRGAVYTPAPWIKEINFKLGYSDYDHTEFEGSEVGTKFLIEGYDGRIELLHEKIGVLEGAFGFESQYNEFSALGEEAFLPQVDNSVNSVFVFEEIPVDQLRFQFGARYDHQSSETKADASFGPGLSRDFDGFSTSGGIVWQPVEDYAVALSLAYTQRPPTYVELFADGPHVATGTFEVGDADLDTEDSLSLDLSVRKRSGRVTGSVSGFYYRFTDFVSAQPTGGVDPDEGLPIYAYQALPADFWGGEVETTFHLLEPVTAPPVADAKGGVLEPATVSAHRLDLILRADYVNAENRDTGEPIPRIPPFRTSLALDYGNGPFSARLEGQYAASQHRHADYELPTDSYFLVNAGVGYNVKFGDVRTNFYVKGVNLTDEEARQSTSFLKDIAPIAGRGVVAGITAEF